MFWQESGTLLAYKANINFIDPGSKLNYWLIDLPEYKGMLLLILDHNEG